jgi:hypothetical protein
MRLTLLAGVAALSFVGVASAQAETIYTSDPAYATGTYTTPGQVVAVPAPPFGPFTPQYVVTQPSVVAAPIAAPREQVIERERIVERPRSGPVRERIIERQRVVAPRVVERERVVVAPENPLVVRPTEPAIVSTGSAGIVTTGSSTSRSCFIDLRGFERCY